MSAYPTRQAIVVYKPVTAGKPGQLCVGHALGHEDRCQDDAGDEVVMEPAPLISARRAQSRHDAGGAAHTAVLSRRVGDHGAWSVLTRLRPTMSA